MIDIKRIREQATAVKENCVRKNTDPSRIDAILELDGQRRTLIQQVEDLKARRNEVSQRVARLKTQPGADQSETDQLIAEMRGVGDEIKNLDEQLRSIDAALEDHKLWIPNIAH
ncbi:MAG: serine--tRNA ligase, partial [Candidatus Kapaibacteriota bacterium]